VTKRKNDPSDQSDARGSARDHDLDSRPEHPPRCEQDDTDRNRIARRIFEDIEKLKDPAVREKVYEDVFAALSKPGDTSIGERLMDAYRQSAADRDGHSSDPVLRDVEYYVLGLSSAANRDFAMVGFTQLTGNIYDALKGGAQALADMGLPAAEYAMRADKSQPTSRSGDGPAIARQGLMLGYRLDGDQCFRVERNEKPATLELRKP
jgi:hypothetical protein